MTLSYSVDVRLVRSSAPILSTCGLRVVSGRTSRAKAIQWRPCTEERESCSCYRKCERLLQLGRDCAALCCAARRETRVRPGPPHADTPSHQWKVTHHRKKSTLPFCTFLMGSLSAGKWADLQLYSDKWKIGISCKIFKNFKEIYLVYDILDYKISNSKICRFICPKTNLY